MVEQVKAMIEAAIPDATAYILDPQNDGQHFQALVISPSFEGLTLVKQHQMVMKPLRAEFDSNAVHALALKTFTPDKWEADKSQYGIIDLS